MNMSKEYRFAVLEPRQTDFAALHNLLWDANSENRNNGFVLKTTTYSADQLMHYLGKDGKCFAAYNENQLITKTSHS